MQAKSILFLLFAVVSIQGLQKAKRDVADYKNDDLLKAVFEGTESGSEKSENRPDRSVSRSDEIAATGVGKRPNNLNLLDILTPGTQPEKRHAVPEPAPEVEPSVEYSPTDELMLLNGAGSAKQRMARPVQSYRDAKAVESPITSSVPEMPVSKLDQTAALVNMPGQDTAIVSDTSGDSVPPASAAGFMPATFHSSTIPMEVAVDPALAQAAMFQVYPDARSSPVSTGEDQTSRLNAVARKSIITRPDPARQTASSPYVASPLKNDLSKKTVIPDVRIETDAPSRSSFPVVLHMKSQNMNLRGVVPHVAEYGETVESVQQAMLSPNAIYKKSEIPKPSYQTSATPLKGNDTSAGLTANSTGDERGQVKQFVAVPVTQQFQQNPFMPGYMNSMQATFNAQQMSPQFAFAQPSTSHVLNMDGFHSRPVVKAEECYDQFQTCDDFARHNYCVDYVEQMKIQCRLSCKFCVPSLAKEAVVIGKSQAEQKVMQNATLNAANRSTETDPDDSESGAESASESGSGTVADKHAEGLLNPFAPLNATLVSRSKVAAIQNGSNVNEAEGAESGSGSSSEAESGSDGEDEISNEDKTNTAITKESISSSKPVKDVISTAKPMDSPESVREKKSRIPAKPVAAKVHESGSSDSNESDEAASGSGSGAHEIKSNIGAKKSVEGKKVSKKGNVQRTRKADKAVKKTKITTIGRKQTLNKEKPSKKSEQTKKTSIPVPAKKARYVSKNIKKSTIPVADVKPVSSGPYPRIDLKDIATALANYEQAALELAGEYPKTATADNTDYSRSFIPHPGVGDRQRLDRDKQNIQIAKLLTEDPSKRFDIPKFLRLGEDITESHGVKKTKEQADTLESVMRRFDVPGLKPSLIDYYAETGKLNPFAGTKRSKILEQEVKQKESQPRNVDPYEYLRNMPPGASMEPIVDPKSKSTIPEDHSYATFLMKVSPGEHKYVYEDASKRGMIHRTDAEGLPLPDAAVPPAQVVQAEPSFSGPVNAPFRYLTPAAEVNPPAPLEPQETQAAISPEQVAQEFQMLPSFDQVMVPAPLQEAAEMTPQTRLPQALAVETPNPRPSLSREPAVAPEREPGVNSLKSKMLSAFFGSKGNRVPDSEDGGSAMGSGDSIMKGDIHEAFLHEGSGIDVANTRSTTLRNLLSTSDLSPSSLHGGNPDWSIVPAKTANMLVSSAPRTLSAQDTAAYLQSNLAALTPEAGGPSFEAQSGLTSGTLGAQLTMRKTQETSWVRPSSESELASVISESSNNVDTKPAQMDSREDRPLNDQPPVSRMSVGTGRATYQLPSESEKTRPPSNVTRVQEGARSSLVKPKLQSGPSSFRINVGDDNRADPLAALDGVQLPHSLIRQASIDASRYPEFYHRPLAGNVSTSRDVLIVPDSSGTQVPLIRGPSLALAGSVSRGASLPDGPGSPPASIASSRPSGYGRLPASQPVFPVRSLKVKTWRPVVNVSGVSADLLSSKFQHKLESVNSNHNPALHDASAEMKPERIPPAIDWIKSTPVELTQKLSKFVLDESIPTSSDSPSSPNNLWQDYRKNYAQTMLSHQFREIVPDPGKSESLQKAALELSGEKRAPVADSVIGKPWLGGEKPNFLQRIEAPPRGDAPRRHLAHESLASADGEREAESSLNAEALLRRALQSNSFDTLLGHILSGYPISSLLNKSPAKSEDKLPLKRNGTPKISTQDENTIVESFLENENSLKGGSFMDALYDRSQVPLPRLINLTRGDPGTPEVKRNGTTLLYALLSSSKMPISEQLRPSNSSPTNINTTVAAEASSFQQPSQYAGWNYMSAPSSAFKPLAFLSVEPRPEQVPIRKNLIKQKPEMDCGEGWEGASGDFGTFCYKQMQMLATFDDALAECRRLKGDLFSVLNAYENRYLQDNIHGKFWIGYRDKGMDGNWNWTDGSKGVYTAWQPDGDNDDNERHDCVYVTEEEGKWKDEACLRKKPFLCKQKADDCPKKWQNLKLNSVAGCYKLFNESKTWEEAEQVCQDAGSHLASISSEDEQTMVVQVHSSDSFWIGLNDREKEGDWAWSDRTTSSYTNWADKAPDNGGVSCAALTDGGKWHDEPCGEKLKFVCKRKGPKSENLQGLDDDGKLLPVSRMEANAATTPSHIYDELAKVGPRPVVPIYFWPLIKNSKAGLSGNRPMAARGNARTVPGGVALDGETAFLDGGDFHGKCVCDPEKCAKGFAVAIQVFLDSSVRRHKRRHAIIDTSGGDRGFTIFIKDDMLHYKVISKDAVWLLSTDITVDRWQDIVMTWHKFKGLAVYVNGAFKDIETNGKAREPSTSSGTARLLIGRESKATGPYVYTKMIIASLAIFTKSLAVEDVPYAFTFDDTVVATYRWLLPSVATKMIAGSPDIEVRKQIGDVDGGLFIDGDRGWLEIDDFDRCLSDISKCTHGFSISFKVKFDQRVRDYKEPKYILDTGGHIGGVKGVSAYVVNNNLYFQAIASPDEDILIWKVRTPVYTVRWQRVVMTWRLDKGLWVYMDGSFRGVTKTPSALPTQTIESPKRFLIGRKAKGPDYAGAQFGFGSLAVYTRYMSRRDAEKVFGGTENTFPGIIREVWKETPGETIKSLLANPDYPNNPTTIEIIENFDAPFNVDKEYGSKLKGYFVAPETGDSRFYLSCSKACELYFSSEEDTKNKSKIISLDKPTWHNQWNKYQNQSSEDISLIAGKYYYLEAVQKGVDNSDSLSVGVRMPTGRYQRPINKENLQWRLPGNPYAGVIREVWYNIPGYRTSDLTSNLNFPSFPSSVEVLDKFDAPFNVDDNYGSRLSGYFRAPETGDYRFYLASDDSGELWLSSDDSESNLVKIITLNGWTEHNQWLKYPEQKSDKVFLASGRYYYIRAYMKAEKLGDCLSVAVELPSGHFEGPIKKKHLSWKLLGSKSGPGPKDLIEAMPKPIGLFTLNEDSLKDVISGKNRIIIHNVDLDTGPGGVKDASFAFKGQNDSYIEIPNNGKLDAKHAITLLANVFPTGTDGPIINYKKDGWGVHLWQFEKTQLFVRFVSRDGKMTTQPLGTRVLELNTWNQVGATYDNNTGVAQVWHDGKMVKSRHIGNIELMTNYPIRVGARAGDDRYFKGKISCIQIYDRALTESQIGDLRMCPKKEGLPPKVEVDNIMMLAQAGTGAESNMEDANTMENRVGEDQEEELIADADRSRATRCEPSPCKNSGHCQNDDKNIDGYKCVCTSDFTGKHCQVSKPAAASPEVKRTEVPKFEKKVSVESYTKVALSIKNATSVKLADLMPNDEKREDISLLYQRVGCFKDQPKRRDLASKVAVSKSTQEDCVKSCALQDRSFSYFGLQNGRDCYCGKRYGKYGKLSDGDCNMKCEGSEYENCGGSDANNVFFFGIGTNYTIQTFTGKKFGAGTDAKIFVEFIGDRGASDFRQLSSRLDKYEAGSVDKEMFVLPDLGKLKRMKILHDNSGTAPSWYLEKIVVTNEDGEMYEFPCNDWLSDTQSGGKLERDLAVKSDIPSSSFS